MNNKKWFYSPQHAKPTDDNIMRLIAPSLLGIMVCLVCLMGMTWAWFSDGVAQSSTRLQAANFSANIVVVGSGGNVEKVADTNTWNLTAGDYTVTITAGGTSLTGGYCEITLAGTKYHTDQIYPKVVSTTTAGRVGSLTFNINVTEPDPVTLSITPQWGRAPDSIDGSKKLPDTRITVGSSAGAPAGGGPEIFEPGTTANSAKNPTSYTVAAGESLSAIAEKFGTSPEKIVAYNGLTDPNKIEAGQKLKIPPANYKLPVEIPASQPENSTESSKAEETEASKNTESDGAASQPETTSSPSAETAGKPSDSTSSD